MKAKPRKPILSMSGKVGGLHAGWHARTRKKTGLVYVAVNGNPCKKPPSEAQIANRKRFAEAVRERWRRYKEERSGENS